MLMKLALDRMVRSSASTPSSGLGLTGTALEGNSVGRSTAGMYMGRGGRFLGDVGDVLPEVLRGEICGVIVAAARCGAV